MCGNLRQTTPFNKPIPRNDPAVQKIEELFCGTIAENIGCFDSPLDMARVLDEATSHLDAETEDKINRVVSTLGIARIIVAHRQETILSCDQILVLDDGRLKHAAGQSSRAIESAL